MLLVVVVVVRMDGCGWCVLVLLVVVVSDVVCEAYLVFVLVGGGRCWL